MDFMMLEKSKQLQETQKKKSKANRCENHRVARARQVVIRMTDKDQGTHTAKGDNCKHQVKNDGARHNEIVAFTIPNKAKQSTDNCTQVGNHLI